MRHANCAPVVYGARVAQSPFLSRNSIAIEHGGGLRVQRLGPDPYQHREREIVRSLSGSSKGRRSVREGTRLLDVSRSGTSVLAQEKMELCPVVLNMTHAVEK